MIHRAKFQNFKALRDVEVTFDSRLTVLVGPNGSGKTSVLKGIEWLLLLGAGVPFDHAFPSREDLAYLRYLREGHLFLELNGQSVLDPGPAGLRVEAARTESNAGQPLTGADVSVSYFGGVTGGQWTTMTPKTKPVFGLASFAQFDPRVLAAPTYPTGNGPILTPRGDGLASALAALALNSPDVFQKISEHLKRIVPTVRRVRFNRFEGEKQERESSYPNDSPVVQIRTHKHIMESLLFDLIGADGIHVNEISDGTLLILGILTLIYLYPRAHTVLLDDIDHGLHPNAQMRFIDLLRQVMKELPGLQIFATSHSPYILNKLKPEEVRLSVLRDDGSAFVAELKDHPQFEKWKDVMTPGEFWSSVGEDWVKQLPAYQTAP